MENYMDWLDSAVLKLKKEQQELENSSRADEANFAKVRINVLEICKTVFGVFKKVKTPEEFDAEYLKKFAELRKTWEESRCKADEHGDVKKSIVEGIKLETLDEAEQKFRELGGN
ncbi:MAG: hypothetical protein ACI4IW_04615 [Oscillospiraceae bacterium]